MDSVVDKYIKYVKAFLTKYYKTLLDNKYNAKLVMPFIEKYIDVRYYNISSYASVIKIVERINKDLRLVAKELLEQNEDKTNDIKNIFALMGYVLYIDEVSEYSDINTLFDTLFSDEIIKLAYTDDVKENFKKVVKDFIKQKKAFYNLSDVKEFELKEKRYRRNLYFVDIDQSCNISKLYSQYAIDKAYSGEIVNENKCLLMYNMLSLKALRDVINLDYKKKYVVRFPESLFSKNKKILRYLNTLNNPLLKQKISIHFTYDTFIKNRKMIESFIKDGYSIAVTLDETYNNDLEVLVLFSYVFVYEKYDYYDMITESRESIRTTIVTI